MNKLFLTFVSVIAITLSISCQGQKAEFTKDGANSFGAEIETSDAVALADVNIADITEEETNATLSGTIEEVCQAKGCWMTLQDENTDNTVFIKFKDYAFFVPKDAGGKKAVIKGKLYAEITPVDELQHYAEDKGKSKDEIAMITEPKKEIKMMADGVVIFK